MVGRNATKQVFLHILILAQVRSLDQVSHVVASGLPDRYTPSALAALAQKLGPRATVIPKNLFWASVSLPVAAEARRLRPASRSSPRTARLKMTRSRPSTPSSSPRRRACRRRSTPTASSGCSARSCCSWTDSVKFPGREFDDLDEYRAAKKQRAARRRELHDQWKP